MIDKKQPIIVVKKVTHGGHGHHGGAWKVAFADFAVAMMAFFLLLWLMGSTTKEEKAAISSYFDNPSAAIGTSATPAPSSVQGKGGSSTSLIDLGGGMEMPTIQKEVDVTAQEEPAPPNEALERKSSAEEQRELQELQQEKQRLGDLMAELEKAINESDVLKEFKDQLLIDIVPEGLRIQIVDKRNRPMFDSGDAHLKWYTAKILFEMSKFINKVPNRISISGHTDASRFVGREDYSNWELSADRANSARRALVDGGMSVAKIGRVVGLASSVLFFKNKPNDPINRRISIIVMNKKTEEAIEKGEGISHAYLKRNQDINLDLIKGKSSGLIELPMEDLGPGATNIDLDR